MTCPKVSVPVNDFHDSFPRFLRFGVNAASTAGNNTLLKRVLFPEPLIPEIAVRRCNGNLMSMPLRLCLVAPRSSNQPEISLRERREPRKGCCCGFLRNWPVSDFGALMISFRVPCATISPPRDPAPGPRSMME